MDEMRGGTRTHCKRRWTPRGFRPTCAVKIGYNFVYLYMTIFPVTGECFAMLLPYMNKMCFALFMAELSKSFPTEKIVLVLDGAGAHQASAVKNPNIGLLHLPPASPELNPVERYFQEMRKALANRVFDNIDQVEEAIVEECKRYFQNPKMVQQLTLFPYIKNALLYQY